MTRWPFALSCLTVGLLIGGLVGHSVLQGQPGAAPAPPVVPRDLTSYRDIVKKVLPAVVSIEGKAAPGRAAPRRPSLDDPRRFFEDDGDSGGTPRLGFGSGFVVDAKGVILTNNHVVDGADFLIVTFQDGRKITTKDVKADPKTDLAIVRVSSAQPFDHLELGDSNGMEIGDHVLAVGAPFGLTGTVTHGIISSKGRSLQMNMYEDFLQTDAAINPGNSGGPLINMEGKVVGINSAIKSRTGGFQGVGLAIASNLARNVMQQLTKEGVVRRGYLGVGIKDLTDRDLAERLGVGKDGGVLVTQVHDKAPGAKAGLKEGDVITALAGKPLRDGRDLQLVVAGLPLGKPVDMAVVRDGKAITLSVVIEEQPRDFGSRTTPLPRLPRGGQEGLVLDRVGAEVSDLTTEVAQRLGYKDVKGALVVKVDPDTAAAAAGLDRGMLITHVEKQPVTTAAEARDAIKKGSLEKGVLLQVANPTGGAGYVLLKTR